MHVGLILATTENIAALKCNVYSFLQGRRETSGHPSFCVLTIFVKKILENLKSTTFYFNQRDLPALEALEIFFKPVSRSNPDGVLNKTTKY
jgi:hypothetical protein